MKITEKKANSLKDLSALSKGYTWYTSTLEYKKGIDGASVVAKKEILSIKVGNQYVIYTR